LERADNREKIGSDFVWIHRQQLIDGLGLLRLNSLFNVSEAIDGQYGVRK